MRNLKEEVSISNNICAMSNGQRRKVSLMWNSHFTNLLNVELSRLVMLSDMCINSGNYVDQVSVVVYRGP